MTQPHRKPTSRERRGSATARHLSILGAGQIGRPIGRHWIRAGHTVTFGSRTPEKLAAFTESLGERARAVSLQQAAADGEIILLSVPYSAVDAVLDDVGALLAGKVVIDASNPFGISAEGRIISTLGDDVTAGSRMAERLPESTIVRAFSHVMNELLERRGTAQPMLWAMAIAGDDPDAKRVVADLVRDTGFTPVDLGGLSDSAPLDPGGFLFPNMFTEADMRARLASVR